MNTLLGVIFGLGPWEIGIIALVGLLLFGKQLPTVGRNLARTITGFRKGLNEIEKSPALKAEDDRKA